MNIENKLMFKFQSFFERYIMKPQYFFVVVIPAFFFSSCTTPPPPEPVAAPEPLAHGTFNFSDNLSVDYQAKMLIDYNRLPANLLDLDVNCQIMLVFNNGSVSDKKPLLTLYYLRNGNTLMEKSVYFPTAFAGASSYAQLTFPYCPEKNSSDLKAKLNYQ